MNRVAQGLLVRKVQQDPEVKTDSQGPWDHAVNQDCRALKDNQAAMDYEAKLDSLVPLDRKVLRAALVNPDSEVNWELWDHKDLPVSKDPRERLAIPVNVGRRVRVASKDPKAQLASTVSPDHRDPAATRAHVVSLA